MITSEDFSMLSKSIEDMKPFRDFNLTEEIRCLEIIKKVIATCTSISENLEENGPKSIKLTVQDIQEDLESLESIGVYKLEKIKSLSHKANLTQSDFENWLTVVMKELHSETSKFNTYVDTQCLLWNDFCKKEEEFSNTEVKCINKIIDNAVADELDFAFLCRNHLVMEEANKTLKHYTCNDIKLPKGIMVTFKELNSFSDVVRTILSNARYINSTITKAIASRITNAEQVLDSILKYKPSIID